VTGRIIRLGGIDLMVVRDPYEEDLLEKILVRLRQMNDDEELPEEGESHVP
jgi:hypothetical protein